MRRPLGLVAGVVIAVVSVVAVTAAQTPGRVVPESTPAKIPRLTARTLRVYEAPEADQGVAADARHFYPVDNSVLARYEIGSGRLVDKWVGPPGLIGHMNSCLADAGQLWCANSNYPQTPMASSVEVFDAATLDHVDSHSLGMLDEGSLTWLDRASGGWVAGFAHYDETGGLRYKDHSFSSVVTFDADWRRTGGWLFPPTVIDRMAPHAASGGAIGPGRVALPVRPRSPRDVRRGSPADGPDADPPRHHRSRGGRASVLVGARRDAHHFRHRPAKRTGPTNRDSAGG